MRVGWLLVLIACSSSRHDDAKQPPPEPHVPAAPEPASKVIISTAEREVTVNVEVVSTPPRVQKGLMFREHLAPDAGMLFLMGVETDHAFYMRNTLIPLDMIFITKDLTIAGIVENAEPRTETLRRVGKTSLYVLEVNGGWTAAHHVAAGAKVRFDGVTPL